MKKLLLILLCMITLTGCQDNTSSPTKSSEKEETPIVEQKKETLDDVTFELHSPNLSKTDPLYATRSEYASTSDVAIYIDFGDAKIDILVNKENGKVYNLQTRELITDKDFIEDIPKGTVYNFMLVSSTCGGGKGLAYNTYIGSPVGSHTLADRVCRAEISQDLINQINSLDGFKVWGVSIPFKSSTCAEDPSFAECDPTNIISIEIPVKSSHRTIEEYRKDRETLEKELHSKFGLIQPMNIGPQGYDSSSLLKKYCDKYNLKCEVVD